MKISFKDKGIKGGILAQYTFTRGLGAVLALSLGELISEYNYACENKLINYDSFLCCITRFAEYTGVAKDLVNNIFQKLEELELISVYESYIEDTVYISMNIEKILETKLKLESENMYGEWDSGLINCLNPVSKPRYFLPSTIAIKNCVDKNFKDSYKIPIIIYADINYWVECYEEESGQKVNNIPNLENRIYNTLKHSDNLGHDLNLLIYDICKGK